MQLVPYVFVLTLLWPDLSFALHSLYPPSWQEAVDSDRCTWAVMASADLTCSDGATRADVLGSGDPGNAPTHEPHRQTEAVEQHAESKKGFLTC